MTDGERIHSVSIMCLPFVILAGTELPYSPVMIWRDLPIAQATVVLEAAGVLGCDQIDKWQEHGRTLVECGDSRPLHAQSVVSRQRAHEVR